MVIQTAGLLLLFLPLLAIPAYAFFSIAIPTSYLVVVLIIGFVLAAIGTSMIENSTEDSDD